MTIKHTLTLVEKIQLIHENEPQVSYHKLADKYKISVGSVSNIVKRKVEYMQDYERNENPRKKHNVRDDFSQQLDEEVYEWFVAQQTTFHSL
jgi:predicted DNA-binding protein YlxM (UPF0122 family)